MKKRKLPSYHFKVCVMSEVVKEESAKRVEHELYLGINFCPLGSRPVNFLTEFKSLFPFLTGRPIFELPSGPSKEDEEDCDDLLLDRKGGLGGVWNCNCDFEEMD